MTIKKLMEMSFVASLAGSILFAIPTGLVNTGVTAGTGCIGTVSLPAGCTLGAQGATGIQGWTLFQVPAGSSTTPVAITNGGGPPVNTTNPWRGDSTTSDWLRAGNGTSPFNGPDTDPLGTYVWRLQFNLTAAEATKANANGSITGRYLSDDVGTFRFNGTQVAINGTGAGGTTAALQTFQTWTPFAITSGFVTGVNIIQVDVTNVSTGFTGVKAASGLRVEFSEASTLPEGGESIGLSLGLGVVLYACKRNKPARVPTP